jgi:hypothetical protein
LYVNLDCLLKLLKFSFYIFLFQGEISIGELMIMLRGGFRKITL